MSVRVRPARPPEAAALSALAMRSKAHWGYDEEFLAACRTELTIAPEWCDGLRVEVAERGGRVAGFYRLASAPPAGELAALFVDEPDNGTGVGGLLFRAATDRARSLGYRSLVITSDPQAEGFYVRHGARRIGQGPSGSIPGRWLPVLRYDLEDPSRLR